MNQNSKIKAIMWRRAIYTWFQSAMYSIWILFKSICNQKYLSTYILNTLITLHFYKFELFGNNITSYIYTYIVKKTFSIVKEVCRKYIPHISVFNSQMFLKNAVTVHTYIEYVIATIPTFANGLRSDNVGIVLFAYILFSWF